MNAGVWHYLETYMQRKVRNLTIFGDFIVTAYPIFGDATRPINMPYTGITLRNEPFALWKVENNIAYAEIYNCRGLQKCKKWQFLYFLDFSTIFMDPSQVTTSITLANFFWSWTPNCRLCKNSSLTYAYVSNSENTVGENPKNDKIWLFDLCHFLAIFGNFEASYLVKTG